MPVTEPANLAFPGRNGDTEETAITNDPANKGFPARLQTGELVFIVKTRHEGHKTKVLIDAAGNEYVDSGPQGFLIAYSVEELPEDGNANEVDSIEASGRPVDGHIGDQIEGHTVEGIGPYVSSGTFEGSTTGEATDAPPSDAA